MCINNTDIFTVPFNNSNVRWKVMVFCDNIISSCWAKKKWVLNKKYKAYKNKSNCLIYRSNADEGFHVLLTKKDAVRYAKHCVSSNIIVKVCVDKFLAAGDVQCSGGESFVCETWKYATAVALYTEAGRKINTK